MVPLDELTINEGAVIQLKRTLSGNDRNNRNIIVNGTKENPVIFTTADPNNATSSRYGYLRLIGDTKTTINHAVFQYLSKGIVYEGESSVYLENVTFRNNNTGIVASDSVDVRKVEGLIYMNNLNDGWEVPVPESLEVVSSGAEVVEGVGSSTATSG